MKDTLLLWQVIFTPVIVGVAMTAMSMTAMYLKRELNNFSAQVKTQFKAQVPCLRSHIVDWHLPSIISSNTSACS